MKKAIVNGEEISADAVLFELNRLVKFYRSHGCGEAEIKEHLDGLKDKALEQAIGAKLLLAHAEELDLAVTDEDVEAEVEKIAAQIGGRENYLKVLAAQGLTEEKFRRELEKGARVNKLVEKALSEVPEPTEAEITAYYDHYRAGHKPEDLKSLVDLHDNIRDLLRHEARGRAMDAYVAELREKATVEYRDQK